MRGKDRRSKGTASSLSLVIFAFAMTMLLLIISGLFLSGLRTSLSLSRGAEQAVREAKEDVEVKVVAELVDFDGNGYWTPGRDMVVPKVKVQNMNPYETTIDVIVIVCKQGNNPCSSSATTTINGNPAIVREVSITLEPLSKAVYPIDWLHPSFAVYRTMSDGWWALRRDVDRIYYHTKSGNSYSVGFALEHMVATVQTVVVTQEVVQTKTVVRVVPPPENPRGRDNGGDNDSRGDNTETSEPPTNNPDKMTIVDPIPQQPCQQRDARDVDWSIANPYSLSDRYCLTTDDPIVTRTNQGARRTVTGNNQNGGLTVNDVQTFGPGGTSVQTHSGQTLDNVQSVQRTTNLDERNQPVTTTYTYTSSDGSQAQEIIDHRTGGGGGGGRRLLY